ncbi:MAG: DNA-3-methyladenine glycosylase [Chloroflexi bacterium]|nr:DNA-3-methyladenine glycosylase [Chloroflexota bacterium]
MAASPLRSGGIAPHTGLVAEGLRYLAAADPVLARLTAENGCPELECDPRLFRTLVSAIVSQQLSGAVASAIMRRLEERCGADTLTAARIASLDAAALRTVGLSQAKVKSLHDLAAHVLSGALEIDALQQRDDETVIAQLTAVRGIGRWTVEMLLIFSLGRPDVWPVDDLGIRKAVAQAYALPALPKPRELLPLGEPWRPYRSVASLLLWRSHDNRPVRATAGAP